MTRQLILILGGARSGKSAHAQSLAGEVGGDAVLYVATAQALDDEMRQRVIAHRAARPAAWVTLEAPRTVGLQILPALASPASSAQVVLVDCLTILASNAILALGDESEPAAAEAAVLAEVEGLLASYAASTATWIVVSNEVGLGLVPPYPLGRTYRDALGRANQRLAAVADRVLFMVAGLPLTVK
jgi:adenosylcobinamide kinase/adenosylcobinamide-phosphate guanylyltransferase